MEESLLQRPPQNGMDEMSDTAAEVLSSDDDSEESFEQLKGVLVGAHDSVSAIYLAVEISTPVNFAGIKSKSHQAYAAIVNKLGECAFELPAPGPWDTQAEAIQELERAVRDIGEMNDIFSAIPGKKQSVEQMIKDLSLLNGFLISSEAMTKVVSNSLIEMPRNPSALERRPDVSATTTTFTYVSSSVAKSSVSSSREIGYNLKVSASVEASFGLVSVDVAGTYTENKYEFDKTEEFNRDKIRTRGKVSTYFYPTSSIWFEDVDTRFSEKAAELIVTIAQNPDKGEQRAAIERFYNAYGSHFFRKNILGGRYESSASCTAISSESRKDVRKEVKEAVAWSVDATASYAKLHEAEAKAKSEGKTATVTIQEMTLSSKNTTSTITTTTLGGGALTPLDVWKRTLHNNRKWQVIYRDWPIPVWKIIELDGAGIPAKYHHIASLFEEVWVQAIFPLGLDEAQPMFKGLKEALKKITTCEELEKEMRRRAARPKIKVVPVFQEGKLEGSQLIARANPPTPDPKYRLIGGGGRLEEDAGGYGLLLTDSYPEGQTWVVRGKAHLRECSGKIYAYAVYLDDPDGMWDVQWEGPRNHTDEVTVTLDEGYVLTGGGARANGSQRMLTKSCPLGADTSNEEGDKEDESKRSWIAKSKAHITPETGTVDAWVCGIRPKNCASMEKASSITSHLVKERTSRGFEASFPPPAGYQLLGGGASVSWTGEGGLLVSSYLDGDAQTDPGKRKWTARCKAHDRPDDSITMDVYTISFKAED